MKLRILKFAVSGALLVWLLSRVNLAAFLDQLAAAEWQWFIYANLLSAVWLVLGVWRWQILLAVGELRPRFGALTYYWLVGQFFGNFLPSSVGGDVVKASMVARECGQGSWPPAASSMLVARVLGLFGMFLVLPLGLVLNYEWVSGLKVQIPLLLALAGLMVLSILVFSDIGNNLLRRFESPGRVGKIVGFIRRLHDSVLSYRRAPRSLLWGLVLSSSQTLLLALQVWLLIQMFPDADIAWSTQIVVFTLATLIAMIPVTINGYGLQEGAYAALLVSLGMTPGQGLVVAVAYRMVSLITGAIGGTMFGLRHERISSVTDGTVAIESATSAT